MTARTTSTAFPPPCRPTMPPAGDRGCVWVAGTRGVDTCDEAQDSRFVNARSVFGAYHEVHLYRRSNPYNPTGQFRRTMQAFEAPHDTHFPQPSSLPTPIRG